MLDISAEERDRELLDLILPKFMFLLLLQMILKCRQQTLVHPILVMGHLRVIRQLLTYNQLLMFNPHHLPLVLLLTEMILLNPGIFSQVTTRNSIMFYVLVVYQLASGHTELFIFYIFNILVTITTRGRCVKQTQRETQNVSMICTHILQTHYAK